MGQHAYTEGQEPIKTTFDTSVHGDMFRKTARLQQLRYAALAAEFGSFRRVGRVVGKNPSQISRKIADLEDHLGVSLFERGAFGVRPTIAGSQFIVSIRAALDQIDEAVAIAGAAGRAETGILRIGIVLTIAKGALRHLIEAYADQHADIELVLVDGGRSGHLAAIRAHTLDVAFLPGDVSYDGFDVEIFWREQVHLAISDTHRLAELDRIDWADLAEDRFLVCRAEPGPEVRRYILRRAETHGFVPNIRHEDVGQETLMNLVAMGRGVTPVAEAWTGVGLPGLALVPLGDEDDIVPFSGYWSPANDNPALRRFLSLARIEAKRNGAPSAPSRTPDPSP